MKIPKYLLFAILFYIPQSFADVQSISKKCASSFFKMQEMTSKAGKQVLEKTSQMVGQAKQIAQNPKPALNQAKETAVASVKKGRQITASAVEQATGMAKQAGSAVANQTKQAVQDPQTTLNQVKETVEKGRQITASAVEQATGMAKQAGSAVAKQTKQTVQDPKTSLNQARETASTGAEKGKQIAVAVTQGTAHAVTHPKETLENAMQATGTFAGQIKSGFEQAKSQKDQSETSIDHLNVSQRVIDVLKQAGIDSIEKLSSYSDAQLLDISGFGPKALEEMQNKVTRRERFTNEFMHGTARHYQGGLITNDLDLLSTRSLNVLRHHGIESIAQLIQYTSEEFRKLDRVGPVTFNNIQTFIDVLGLKFAGSSQNPANVHTNL